MTLKERDLFLPVKQLLHELGFPDVYGEVGLIDVVGISDNATVAVEMKLSLNMKVFEQAVRSQRYAEQMYIAVPKRKDYVTWEKKLVFEKMGLGLIYVKDGKAWVAIDAPYNEPKYDVRDDIQPHHLITVGGSKSGDTVTGYKYTMAQVRELLESQEEPVTIDFIFDNVQHHYYGKSAKRSLASTLGAHWNKHWIRIDKIKNRNYYSLQEGVDASTRIYIPGEG